MDQGVDVALQWSLAVVVSDLHNTQKIKDLGTSTKDLLYVTLYIHTHHGKVSLRECRHLSIILYAG